MKKLLAFFLVFSCLLPLTACQTQAEDQLIVYAFHGENEYFTITNGTIVFSDSQEVFYGGNLLPVQSNFITDIASYTATFYTIVDGQQETILIDSLSNFSSAELVNIDFGKKVTKGPEISKYFQDIEESNRSLWCELSITDKSGNLNCYNIELKLIAITK